MAWDSPPVLFFFAGAGTGAHRRGHGGRGRSLLGFAFGVALPGTCATGKARLSRGGLRSASTARRCGGGGRGGGANGFKNFKVSVCERSLPSSSSMNTSRAILGYSGKLRRNSRFGHLRQRDALWTSRHLVKKFLDLLRYRLMPRVTARNRTISGRAERADSSARRRGRFLAHQRFANSLA